MYPLIDLSKLKPTKHLKQRFRKRVKGGKKMKEELLIKQINRFKQKLIEWGTEEDEKGNTLIWYLYLPQANSLVKSPFYVLVNPKSHKMITIYRKNPFKSKGELSA